MAASRISSDNLQEGRIGIAIRREADRPLVRSDGSPRSRPKGKSNKQIATVLDLSVKTVESHRTSAMRKLGLKSLPDLVRFAIRNRIVEA